MSGTTLNACLSRIVNAVVHHGGGPAGPHQRVVDLVSGAPVVGEPCQRVVRWVLEVSAGNHKAVRLFMANSPGGRR